MVQRKRTKPSSSKSKKGIEIVSKKTTAASEENLRSESAMVEDFQTLQGVLNEVEEYAIIQLDLKGTIKSWNKGAESIKGYKAKEIVGKNYRMFYTSEDKMDRLSEKLLEEAKQQGKTSYEGWRIRKNGTRFWGSMTLTALHDADGGVSGFLKVTRDLTERKIAEDNFSNFVEELKMKNQALRESEERYHKMIAEVRDYAIILLDSHGKVLDWNQGAEKLKGYTPGEIVGKSFRLFYPREEKDAGVPEMLLSTAEKEGSVTHEGWRIRKDGKRFWGNIVITALHDDEGKLIGFSKVTRDLTEKKNAEDLLSNLIEELRHSNEDLKRSEERYHRMIAEIQDYAIILLNEKGNIENWNAGAQVIKGYTRDEVFGKNFRIFYPAVDQRRGLPEQLLKEARQRGKITHEGWRVRKDGSQFWGNVVITALHNEKKEVIGFSKVTRDLTERKLAEEALQRSAAQLDLKNQSLERLNAELSSFTYVASHDLKEPLRKILTFASRIKDVDFSRERSDEFLNKIALSAVKMQNLIDNLLSYSQVSNDQSRFESVDLNEVFQSAKADLEVLIHEKRAQVQAGRLPVIHGIGYQMQQVFMNLISNALKFSKDDRRSKIIVKSKVIKGPDVPFADITAAANKYHHISFRDNGIGFKQEDADKIFHAFHRLHAKAPIAGTGIGLSIVKKVVDNHHGIISAEGIPGEGAVFNIYLPL
ncbi:PAS domain-containing sensor histidine kinase [Pseudochryseolinea flava]|uniref:histidine kinase n=1 Tax=Pseudochryseolinea flava TaxID=2059302 RepID=A0A364Y7T0_9BACT|nr:PAS domain-containing sensor histidine kinase [Pseudochryseolinea flava]RAW02311.1 hypothetical protein DQQ10_07190 [Pseudochryseolinea flava]